jgi:hypothetical protein
MFVDADGVARNDYNLAGERAGDLVYNTLQHGKPRREDDGIGSAQRVAVVDGDDRTATDPCSQLRADPVSALDSRGVSPPEANRRAMTDPIPPVPRVAVVMTEPPQPRAVDRGLLPGELTTVDSRDIAGDLGIHSESPARVLGGQ